MNHFAKMCREPKQRNFNRNVQNIGNNNDIYKETAIIVDIYNTKHSSDSISSYDIWVAKIANEGTVKIIQQNMKATIGTTR